MKRLKLILSIIVISLIFEEASACCCSRLDGAKGCERFNDWNECIQRPCDWLGNLKPPCEDSCFEHRMKEQAEKAPPKKDPPKKKKKKNKKKKEADADL